MGLNEALEGGLPYGRTVMIYGNKSAGKTSWCLELVAMAQAEGKICAWIDAENCFSASWAKSLGVDVDSLILSRARSTFQAGNDLVKFMQAGFDVIILDSISVLLPPAFFETPDSEEMKNLEKTQQIGSKSKALSALMNAVNYSNDDTLLVIISQTTTQIGQMYSKQVPDGGNRVLFNSSVVIKVFATDSKDKQIKAKVKNGDMLFEQEVGRPVTWTVEFSKTSPMHVTGDYDFYYRGDNLGVDRYREVVDLGIKYGIIVAKGAWFYPYGEEKGFNGKPKFVAYLRENKELFEKIEGDILGRIR